jgi:hypothetical protein
MATKLPPSEFGGEDGQFGNVDAGAPLTPYLEALAYRQSVGRIDAVDPNGTGQPLTRSPKYGSAGRPA